MNKFSCLYTKFGYSKKAKKCEKNLPQKIWHYWVASNFKWKIFSNFVAFSEYPNFTAQEWLFLTLFTIILLIHSLSVVEILSAKKSFICIDDPFSSCGHQQFSSFELSTFCYSLINMRQLQILIISVKTWPRIVCWFSWISLFLRSSCMTWS